MKLNREASVSNASRGLLVQECHVGHRAALSLRVHHNTVPARQRDGRVVRVADRSASINARIASHDTPTPAGCAGSSLEETLIFVLRETVRVLCSHVNDFTAGAKDLLHHMRLARATTQRFIAQNEFVVHDQ